MAIEIERKFLVANEDWRTHADEGTDYVQGYLVGSVHASVRVRIEGECAFLNIKGATLNVKRLEFEYPVPLDEAQILLNELCEKPWVEKRRFHLDHARHEWSIDVFKDDNAGLVLAEIELQDETESFAIPSWVGAEVSHDARYYNVNLSKHPYKGW